MNNHLFKAALTKLMGEQKTAYLLDVLDVHPSLLENKEHLTRAQIAQLMNMLLFDDLLTNVPEAKCYADEQRAEGRKIKFDHGALRTIAMHMKELPQGKDAFSRILEPMGYELAGEYPLDKLKMCGFVYTHQDLPEDIAQYFVSELYTDRFSLEFEKSVWGLVYESADPISKQGKSLLEELSERHTLDVDDALCLLKEMPACFARQHDLPSMEQYQAFLKESAEMAWISTEGNAFNHATDRVVDLDALEMDQKLKGRAMKPKIEEGANANIRQTAYRASVVEREFQSGDELIEMQVPGSFFEFIQRGEVTDPETDIKKMDLRFDSRNAQGIFKMTRKYEHS